MLNAALKPDLLVALEDQGYRLTGPRRIVAGLLAQKDGAFSLEQVCAELPMVGRATVYRTVRLLLEAGVLCKTSLPSGEPRYSVDHSHHHHHIVCVKCGRVQEFRHASVERMLRSLGAEIPGELVGHRIELYINCQECIARG